jgi:hypothetical protein
MGQCSSGVIGGSKIDPCDSTSSKHIDKMLRQEKKLQETAIKLLLLGWFADFWVWSWVVLVVVGVCTCRFFVTIFTLNFCGFLFFRRWRVWEEYYFQADEDSTSGVVYLFIFGFPCSHQFTFTHTFLCVLFV